MPVASPFTTAYLSTRCSSLVPAEVRVWVPAVAVVVALSAPLLLVGLVVDRLRVVAVADAAAGVGRGGIKCVVPHFVCVC